MAITNKQLEQLGFVKNERFTDTLVKIQEFALYLEEDGIMYARFWKERDKLYCAAIDKPEDKEFIYLEHLTIKGLTLFIERTAQRLRKWKRNQEHIQKLLHGDS